MLKRPRSITLWVYTNRCKFADLISGLLIFTTFLVFASSRVHAAEVGALGYISPQDKIIFLVGTPGTEIESIKVKPHDKVKRGQVLMVFSNFGELKNRLDLAKLALKNQQVLGPERIKMQEVKRALTQVNTIRAGEQLNNYQNLSKDAQLISEMAKREQEYDEARYQLELEELRLTQAKREAELATDEAQVRMRLARKRLESGRLVAPRDGIILEVRKQVGETIGDEPALLLADVSSMYAICEVYESDLLKIKEDMDVTVSSNSLPKDIKGKVERVNRTVDTTSRLGKVLVKLDNGEWAPQLIGLEVNVVIHL